MVHNVSVNNSIFNHFLNELRNVDVQVDSMRFRKNLERAAEIMAYEISKKLEYENVEIQTPLGIAKSTQLKNQPVLATILRAGLAMHQGFLNYFDGSESAFISAYRKHTSVEDFEVYVEYLAAPDIDHKTLIIIDPMLATGMSMYLVYKALLKHGKPNRVIIAAAIAAPEALEFLKERLPKNTEIWVGAIDEELTAESYIVPGLGDAGDLAYGNKI